VNVTRKQARPRVSRERGLGIPNLALMENAGRNRRTSCASARRPANAHLSSCMERCPPGLDADLHTVGDIETATVRGGVMNLTDGPATSTASNERPGERCIFGL